ncbi:YigZ family protein [Streptobacillus felis]|uniref:YigZ family protein n=1 Tax=Streptobacillus felis TaxID=1384509 RepID=A0A7Z0T6T5_9FUSO|nr:YigZ family protein [Streptobacillus felis]NYV27561.1 YigZ family protein [Streptobacillus felis]
MNTVEKETVIEFIEKKSKFIGYIKPVSTVKEAEKFIEMINEKHFDATHNVYAYKVIENNQKYFKFNDNGEPVNTAGKPMAEIITRLGVSNLVVVATRYFGGIKLGVGGLIRNYAKCAKLAINEAGIVEYVVRKIVLLDFDYSKSTEVETLIEKNNIEVLDKVYNERVMMRLRVSDEALDKIKEIQGIILIEM